MQEHILSACLNAKSLPDLENQCAVVLCKWNVQTPAFLFALHEVLINALEISHSCSFHSAWLCVRLRLKEDTLEAEVPDDGPGMPTDWRERYLEAEMTDRLAMERGRGLLFIKKLGFTLDSSRDHEGKHIVILKARITHNE